VKPLPHDWRLAASLAPPVTLIDPIVARQAPVVAIHS